MRTIGFAGRVSRVTTVIGDSTAIGSSSSFLLLDDSRSTSAVGRED
jgi:hypothetical protein